MGIIDKAGRAVGFVSALMLAACTTQTQPPYETHYTSSFISVAEPGFQLRQGDSFAWLGQPEIITDDSHNIAPETLTHLRSRFEQNMRSQGFDMAASANGADYLLSAAIILGTPISEQELVEKFDIAPSLTSGAEYDAGTLVMRVISPGGMRTQWRGAIEIFTDPQQTSSERQRRVDSAVDTFARHLQPK
ncbi:DUF4136 domain-containing protein [Gilvimarinus sp. DA14]|uniref:DUF4136 domain-containing protein n=1 Tax=Gilvimarinus sp. DA14 TaxID=2956798 RepID=UPI0020B79858|nr:DUF4136 domain-containing protein [Gilvimarinus sp. DA14]UTF59039.1 hypothetical protein NHM04_11180 [Gilvimarinus sp. DA14]